MEPKLVFVLITLSTVVHSQNSVFKFDLRDVLRKYSTDDIVGKKGTSKLGSRPVQGGQENPSTSCGYESCTAPKPGMLNVHLVPHTHDDVGWLMTVDQYYYKEVQYILDSVVDALQDNPQRRFIYVEVAFFYRWWRQQHDSVRHVIKGLVNDGRLEFILGGWCMNDEAATHYNAIIDQHTAGFKFLKDNFGDCGRPRIGWQIDPFGHSREQASLFAQFGFDGLFFGRLDFQDKATRQKLKTMEMLWQGSPSNLRDQSALLTGVNFNGYGPPGGFCFDQYCDDYIQDDDRMEDYNKDDKVKDFIKAAEDQAKSYSTNQIMMTMGSDFQFQNGHKNFKNLDKLIAYVNDAQEHGSKVNVLYSTPSCYLHALNQANQTYTTKEDDFFPYAHRNHSFWTGYFTSRAALKGYARQANNVFQACKQLDALTQLGAEYGSDLKIDVLRQALGVVQHHDGISGTEKQAVAYDYAMRLANGLTECGDVINYAYGKLLAKSTGVIPSQHFCPLVNVSNCPTTENAHNFTVIIYNPVGRPVSHWVRVPVTGSAYTVTDPNNKPVTSQVTPVSAATANIPGHNGSKATGDLVFRADLPPLGFNTYFVALSQGEKMRSPVEAAAKDQDVVIENKHLRLTFDPTSGLLKAMTNKDESLTSSVSQSLLYYQGMKGNNSAGQFQASGAYIFRPASQMAQGVAEKATVTVVKKGQVQEVRQVFSDWASQVVRLYDGAPYAEFEFTIGPIPFSDTIGREVISRFSTDLSTQSTFYTDANGREVLKRVRDYRPTWKLNQTEPVAGNYYPVNSRIYIRDETKKTQFTVLTDRSQGGASIRDGQLELMIHRRTMDDDALGVGEPLNETGISGKGLVVRGKHYVMLSSVDLAARLHRNLAEQLYMAPVVSYSPLSMDPGHYRQRFATTWSGVAAALPDNVHLLTLEQWRGRTYLLRLEHFYETGEDARLSQPANVSLKNLFTPFSVSAVTELTLGANQDLATARRLSWNLAGRSTNGDMSSFVTPVDPTTLTVVLRPMQIRTFEVTVA